MSESFFGKGITVASGFDLSAKSPLDTREVVETFDNLADHVVNNRAYDGMLCYVKEDKVTYQYIDSEWKVFGVDLSNVGENTNLIIDNLNSILINASLSANQGRVLREMIDDIKINYSTKEEIAQLEIRVNNKDAEIMDLFNNINQFLPKKISFFENDAKYLTEGDLEETLKHITIPAKTSDLINDAGYVTQENIDEVIKTVPVKTSQLENDAGYITEENINVFIDKIPIKTSQLENDANFITQNDLDEALADIEFTGGGSSNIHIDSNEPSSKNVVWIDTSTPSNLKVINYDERIKLKYIEMLNLTKVKLSNLDNKLGLIEGNINKISSDNADKISTFKSTLGNTRSQITLLILQIEDLISKETIEKERSKELRKQSKRLLYSLSDFNDEVMRVLDSELKLDISGGGSNDNDDIQTDGASLLTEDGFVLLTEDGLMLLADGVATSTILADAILTELGLAILTEDGKQILKG